MRKRNVEFAILFLRWPEEPAAFAALLRRHCAIARTFGGYRISIPAKMLHVVRETEADLVHLEFGTDFTNHFRGSGLKEL